MLNQLLGIRDFDQESMDLKAPPIEYDTGGCLVGGCFILPVKRLIYFYSQYTESRQFYGSIETAFQKAMTKTNSQEYK